MPLKLIHYPDPVLKKRAAPVKVIDDEVRERVREMFGILYKEKGIGLAAPQVGWSVRLFIVNTTGEEDPSREEIYINPRLFSAEGAIREEEGCLSIPGIRGMVNRSRRVSLKAQSLEGKFFEEEAIDLKARVIQHEFDHLDGILFISRLSSTDRTLISKMLKKLENEYADRTIRAK